jgi:hypothetical protein
MLALGLIVTAGSAFPLVRGVMSLAWPVADGFILFSRDTPGTRTIGVDVRYRYASGGRTYEGDRYRFQSILVSGHMTSRDVQSALGRYRPGEPVKIAVNPSDPSDSVLERGPDGESVFPLLMGLAMMVLGMGQVRRPDPVPAAPAVSISPGPRYRTAKVLAVIGFGLLALGASPILEGIQSLQWPAVEGRILYSHARTASSPETLLWYEYSVGQVRYMASKYRTGGNATPFRSVAQAAAKRYPVGRKVMVCYDPADPQRALLEPGVWWGNFVLPAIALLVLGVAWVAMKYARAVALQRRA